MKKTNQPPWIALIIAIFTFYMTAAYWIPDLLMINPVHKHGFTGVESASIDIAEDSSYILHFRIKTDDVYEYQIDIIVNNYQIHTLQGINHDHSDDGCVFTNYYEVQNDGHDDGILTINVVIFDSVDAISVSVFKDTANFIKWHMKLGFLYFIPFLCGFWVFLKYFDKSINHRLFF